MIEWQSINVSPIWKFLICDLLFIAIFVVYWWEPKRRNEPVKQEEDESSFEIDPSQMVGTINLLETAIGPKKRSTQHVTLELLDEYVKELKKHHIRSFDEV